MAKKLDINKYPGAKTGSGVKEFIINNIPEFESFVELFGGSAVITQTLSAMLQGKCFSVCELDFNTAAQLLVLRAEREASWKVIPGNGLALLSQWISTRERKDYPFIYADPPYIKEARKGGRDLYNHEWTMLEHIEFLDLALQYRGKLMISGYSHPLYNEKLSGWSTKTFRTMTRNGVSEEKIWVNYDPQKFPLATIEFLGKNFTDRQRIKRKVQGYGERLKKMPLHERQAVLQHIKQQFL